MLKDNTKLVYMKKKIFIPLSLYTFNTSSGQVIISLLLEETPNSEKVEFGLIGGLDFANLSNTKSAKNAHFYNVGIILTHIIQLITFSLNA